MIDAEKMKAAPHAAHALPPPIEISIAHDIPAEKWDAPVLPPFLRELVFLEIGFGRGAAGPIQRKFVWPRKNVRTVVTNPEWDVTHEGDAALFGVGFDGRPLFVRNPLPVPEKHFAPGKNFACFR